MSIFGNGSGKLLVLLFDGSQEAVRRLLANLEDGRSKEAYNIAIRLQCAIQGKKIEGHGIEHSYSTILVQLCRSNEQFYTIR